MDCAAPIGPTVGRYIVREALGEGGVAAVYRVHDPHRSTDHALKYLTMPGRDQQRRLILEGQALASIEHPNVVGLHDVVEHLGLPGLVLDLVPGGRTLDSLRGTALPVRRLTRLARGLMAGLEAVHMAGYLHRDLKPANVLLATHGPREVPRLADFGIARSLNADDPVQTRPGVVIGTPAYMAPEQIYDATCVDRRSDLWSLGCVLYQLATGAPPFAHASSFATMHAVVHKAHVPLRAHRPDLPRRISDTVDACLAKDPDERPNDVAAVRTAWEAVQVPAWAVAPSGPPAPSHLEALLPRRAA